MTKPLALDYVHGHRRREGGSQASELSNRIFKIIYTEEMEEI
jgi:hypothetical protein